MDEIGVFSPEQARTLWQDYLTRRQLQPHSQANYPQRRPIDEPSPHRVFVRNDSDEECPGYGCLQVTGVAVVGGQTVLTCTKPTSTEGEFLFNSPYPIAADANGWAYRYGIVIALGNGTPPTAANVLYQPVVDTWTIEEGGSLFTVFGEHNVATDAVIGRFEGGASPIVHGIVGAEDECNPGYYTIQLAEWSGTHVHVAEVDPEPCPTYTITGEGTTACAIELIQPALQVTGTGIYVKAYDCAANRIPLITGTQCLLTNLGDTVAVGPEGEEVTTPVWQIVRGRLHEEVYYEEEWDCCDGVDETGVETLISRTPSIVAAIRLPTITCGSCEVP